MNKTLKKTIIAGCVAAGTVYCINKFIELDAEKQKEKMTERKGDFFDFGYGKIYYEKHGKGSPMLLIHEIGPEHSLVEWDERMWDLAKDHTVYTLDLLGSGKSDKPDMIYSNFLYVKLITSFIKEVVKDAPVIMTKGSVNAAAIMAVHMDKEIATKIIMVNPPSMEKLSENPNKYRDIAVQMLNLPLVGDFAFNLYNLKYFIDERLRKSGTYSPQAVNYGYVSAHTNQKGAKALLISVLGKYTGISISHALNKLEIPVQTL